MESGEPAGRVDIIEAVNEDLHEIYVGCVVAGLEADRIAPLILTRVPAWRPDQKIHSRVVETRFSAAESTAFKTDYALTISRLGWKVLTD